MYYFSPEQFYPAANKFWFFKDLCNVLAVEKEKKFTTNKRKKLTEF